MLVPERSGRIHAAFDDRRPVANAGLVLSVSLAHRPGLGGPVDHYVDPEDEPVSLATLNVQK